MPSGPDGVFAVVLLAGGEATRFPGKLERPLNGMPLLGRTYESVRDIGPVAVSVRDATQAAVLAGKPFKVVLDAQPGSGPLGALVSTFEELEQAWVFVVAGDAPFAGRELFDALVEAWKSGCEAVVPVDAEGTLQPLSALYERTAFLRESARPAARASGAVRRVVEGLRAVRVRHLNERVFFNVNTEAEYRAANEGIR